MAFAEGAGAAGGLGYALLTYLKAELRSGIDFLLDIADFDNMIDNANLVITGEGKSDAQTMMGKVPHALSTNMDVSDCRTHHICNSPNRLHQQICHNRRIE